MTCPNCDVESANGQPLCANCGHRMKAEQSRADFGAMIIWGAVVGVVLTLLLWFTGMAFLANVRPPPQYPSSMDFEFAVSKGEAALWLSEGLAFAAAFVYLLTSGAKKVISANARGFLLGLCFITLGGMALCNAFSLPALFDRRY